jgi:hypothetical protein
MLLAIVGKNLTPVFQLSESRVDIERSIMVEDPGKQRWFISIIGV